jgi:hypothetical protein
MANEIKDITVTKTAVDVLSTDLFEGQTAAGGAGSTFKISKEELLKSTPDSSETVKGIIEIATQAEVTTGTDDLRAITPLKLATAVPAASETAAGKAEIATQAETNTGTDDVRFITPLKAATRYQVLDSDLTAIAALTPSNDDVLQRKSGAWTNRTVAQLQADLISRVQSVVSAATVTPNANTDDMVKITAQAAALALANPSGTPTEGQGMVIRIKDNGTARAISYDTQYRQIGVVMPLITVISKTTYIAMIYNATDSMWDVIFTKTQV